jgi:TolB-like protein/DNA-binding winged helix-turn-helix (wHTH) protein
MRDELRNGFRFGRWQAFPMRNLLASPAGETRIEPKVMQVLTLLAAAAPEVVERSRLLDEIWAGRAMSDEPLTRCIATLRRVLEDSAKDPQYIQTVPKLGYRLVSPVEALNPQPAGHAAPLTRRNLRLGIGIAVAITVVVAATAMFLLAVDNNSLDHVQVQVDGAQVREAPVNSIAVLPFANLSPDPDNEYLSDGLAAELLNHLSRIPDLKVAARTSAFSFKDQNVSATEIATKLRVAHILMGSVRKSGNRLRISAQLVDASDGYQVWTNTWEREFTDVFDLQDEIASAVVGSLRLQLADGLPTVGRANPEAYALFLKAREMVNEPELGGEPASQFDPALMLITQSIAIDPDYAPTWGALAE